MSAPKLEFRSTNSVLLAFLVAPPVAVGVLFLVESFYGPGPDLSTFLLVLMAGSLAGMVVEGVFAVPLLLAFRRYRWGWFNRWWLAGYGFLAGESVLALVHWSNQHWFGWGALLQGLLACGLPGLTAAAVFGFIAFRRHRPNSEADVF